MKILLIALILIMVSSQPTFADNDLAYIRIMAKQEIHCGYAESPPFMVIDPNTQKPSGLVYDLWELIGKKLNFKINWSNPISWGEVTGIVNSNKIDVFCGTLWPDAGRRNNMLLSRPFMYTPLYLFSRSDDKRFDNNYDLINDPKIRTTGQDGDVTAVIFSSKFPKATAVNTSATAQSNDRLLNLASNKGDIIIDQVNEADLFMMSHPNKIRRILGAPITIMSNNFAMARGEYQLKSMIDGALDDLINDGTIAALIKKYDAVETYAPQPDVVVPAK